jgi:glycosyltransferase involved in cell wall biosynthesis
VLPTNGDFIQRHAESVALLHHVTAIHVKTDPKVTDNIEITEEIIHNVRTLIAYIKPSVFKPLLFYFAYKSLLKRAGHIDVIHVNKLYPVGLLAWLMRRLNRLPYLITEHHSIYQFPRNKTIGWIEKFLSKQIVKKAGFVCPVSDNLGKSMQEFGLSGTYQKVPNVVNTEIFAPKKRIKNDLFTITHVSNMVELKNIEGILLVIKAFQKKVSQFKLNLIGSDFSKFESFVKENKIDTSNITNIRYLPQDELARYYRESDVFLLFSNTENLPCVVLESFSSGTPVISSDVGGVSEYFPESFGILVEKGNEKQLLEALLRVYNRFDSETPELMHQYAVTHFSPMSIAKQFSKLYMELLSL